MCKEGNMNWYCRFGGKCAIILVFVSDLMQFSYQSKIPKNTLPLPMMCSYKVKLSRSVESNFDKEIIHPKEKKVSFDNSSRFWAQQYGFCLFY
jgi:hypothetical protein